MRDIVGISILLVLAALPAHGEGAHAEEETLRAREASRARAVHEFAQYCPKQSAADSGVFCTVFSRPNDDPAENYGARGPYETARFIPKLQLTDDSLVLDFGAHAAVSGYERIPSYGLQDFKNPFEKRAGTARFAETKEEPKSKNLHGKLWNARLALGKVPKQDGVYTGEILIRNLNYADQPGYVDAKHKFIWTATVKNGKLTDVAFRFDQKASELKGTYSHHEPHDLLPVLTNISDTPVVLPYPPRSSPETWRPAIVQEVDEKDIPGDLPF